MPSCWTTLLAALVLLAYTASAQPASTDVGECDPVINCDARGDCAGDEDDWYCICNDGYATFPKPVDDDPNPVYCNYERKSQLTAFLLSWFLGLAGGGQWYIGLYSIAGWKLGLLFGFCCCGTCLISLCCTALGIGSKEDMMSGPMLFVPCWMCCCSLAVTVWWIVDLVYFGQNLYDDGNGVSLEPW